jgi:hypothetical protein
LWLLIHCLIVPLSKQTTMRDVDPPLTVEETLAGMRRNLQMLYQCNRALIRATEEYELLQSVCQILVDVGGLRMVWIGYRQFDRENTIRPVAIAGYDERYVETVKGTWADSERGHGPLRDCHSNWQAVLDQGYSKGCQFRDLEG